MENLNLMDGSDDGCRDYLKIGTSGHREIGSAEEQNQIHVHRGGAEKGKRETNVIGRTKQIFTAEDAKNAKGRKLTSMKTHSCVPVQKHRM
jgi:hypothetical protein